MDNPLARELAQLPRRLGWLIGTGLGSGLSPVAPGTAGSLVAVVIYYLLPVDGDSLAFISMILVGFLVGVWATGTLATPEEHDPGQAVWDEFVGVWATCLLLPKEILWLAGAFLCFRALDVLKPWPARRLEALPGGWGIMADDLMVALYGTVLLNVIQRLFFP
ncbi:MAG: phosphatidylglycerophosphatase A [Dehalococcoidia bacterium]